MESFSAGRGLKKFNQLISEIDAAYHEVSRRLGLSDSVEMILYSICNLGSPCLLSEIVRFSAMSKQTINSAIRKMEGEELLFVRATDGRKKQVVLTEKGEKLAQETTMRVIEIENEIYSSWTEEEMTFYLELTQRYLQGFQEKTKHLKRREEE